MPLKRNAEAAGFQAPTTSNEQARAPRRKAIPAEVWNGQSILNMDIEDMKKFVENLLPRDIPPLVAHLTRTMPGVGASTPEHELEYRHEFDFKVDWLIPHLASNIKLLPDILYLAVLTAVEVNSNRFNRLYMISMFNLRQSLITTAMEILYWGRWRNTGPAVLPNPPWGPPTGFSVRKKVPQLPKVWKDEHVPKYWDLARTVRLLRPFWEAQALEDCMIEGPGNDYRTDECWHMDHITFLHNLQKGARSEIKSKLHFLVGKKQYRKLPTDVFDLMLDYALVAEGVPVHPEMEAKRWVEVEPEEQEYRKPGELVDGKELVDKPIEELKCGCMKDLERKAAHLAERQKRHGPLWHPGAGYSDSEAESESDVELYSELDAAETPEAGYPDSEADSESDVELQRLQKMCPT